MTKNMNMSPKLYYKVTSVLFFLIAVGHLLRIVNAWEAEIGGFIVPFWMSWVAVVVAGYLAYRGFTTKKAR